MLGAVDMPIGCALTFSILGANSWREKDLSNKISETRAAQLREAL
jgi:hypothetical protein